MILPFQKLIERKLFDELHESQYQPAGVDITLKEARKFEDAGTLDFDNSGRVISGSVPMEFEGEKVHLRKGAYKVLFNEYVRIPKDVAGFCMPRSSLLRCGATLECAVWDPGYEGRSEALLVVMNEHGIVLKKNAKIGQMVFIGLSDATDSLYSGRYKGENR